MRTGQSAKRSEKVWKCCSASSVVGQRITTCLLSATAANAARSALGLAEADVAAHQAVHRLAGRHVGDHRVDRRRLVGRLLEAEAVGERLEIMLLDRERVTQPGGALGVQREQLGRGVAHLLRGARLGLVPLAAAELVQRRLLGLRAAVAADHAELRDRHVELVAAFVLEQQELGIALANVQADQPLVAADAVLLVHHRLADLELGRSRSMPSTEVRFSAPRPRRRTTPA